MSSARWGWGPDLSREPWMNQPDHSRPICGDGAHKFFLQPFKSFSFPFSPPDSGFSRVAVAEGASLELALSRVLTLDLHTSPKIPYPERRSSPGPGSMPHTLSRGQGCIGLDPGLTHLVYSSNNICKAQRSCPLLIYSRVTFSAVLGSRSVEKQNPSQNHSKFTY